MYSNEKHNIHLKKEILDFSYVYLITVDTAALKYMLHLNVRYESKHDARAFLKINLYTITPNQLDRIEDLSSQQCAINHKKTFSNIKIAQTYATRCLE